MPPISLEGTPAMAHSGALQLNKLNYDREREIVDFAFRRNIEGTMLVVEGEVPLMVIDQGNLRQSAKAAVRQALLDAAEVLAEPEEAHATEVES